MRPQTNNIDFNSLQTFIKKAMKVQKITYGEIAKELNISESGVKKIFNKEDCSFNRLIQICNILKLDLNEMLSAHKKVHVRHFELPREQELFFEKNPDYFNVFWKLVHEDYKVEDLKKEFDIDDKQMFRYLKKLDDFNLVTLMPDNQVKVPDGGLIRFSRDSEFLRSKIHEWSRDVLEEGLSSKPTKRNLRKFLIYTLREESLAEVFEKMGELDKFIRERASHDSNFYKDVKPVRFLTVVMPESPVRGI